MKTITEKPGISRRAVVRGACGLGLLWSLPSPGGEPSKLDTKDPAAVAVGYVEDSARVDVKKYPGYVQGSRCENCLQLQGSVGNNYRPCAIFPGNVVAVSGWCSSWTAEM